MCIYLNDILVTGMSDEEHLHNLSKVLQRLETASMKLKKETCAFFLPRVDYLGHGNSSKGLELAASKVAAIVGAPAPRNLTELRFLTGLVNYYRKFYLTLPQSFPHFIASCRMVRYGSGVVSSRKH